MARVVPIIVLLVAAGWLTAADAPNPLTVLKGHGQPVYAVAFSGDARIAATGSFDQTVKLWDPTNGRELRTLGGKNGHADQILAVAFSPDGTFIASGGSDRQLKLWPVPPRVPTRTFDLPSAATSLAVSRDDKLYAVGTATGAVRLINAMDGKSAGRLIGHDGPVTGLAFAPGGQFLVTVGADNTLRYWDPSKDALRATVTVPGTRITGLLVAPNGTVHTATAGGTLRTWPDHLPVPNNDTNPPADAGFVADAKRTVDDPATVGSALAVTPNGSHLLTAGTAASVVVRNAVTFEQERTFGVTGRVSAVAVSRDSGLVAIAHAGADGKAPRVTLVRWNNGIEAGSFPTPTAVTGLEFHPDGSALAAVLADGEAIAWSVGFDDNQPLPVTFGRPVQAFACSSGVRALAFNARGDTVLMITADKHCCAWAFTPDQPARTIPHPHLVDAVAFDPAGVLVATGCHDGHLRLWDAGTGKLVRTIAAHTTPIPAAVYCVAWSPDGKQVVTGSFDRTVRIWDAKSGRLVREIPPGVDRFPLPANVRVVAPAVIGAPGAGWLAAPPDVGHRDQVFGLAIGPTGKRLATGSSDRTAVVWNYATGCPVRPLANQSLPPSAPGRPQPAHPGSVTAIGFTPDGSRVVTAGPAPHGLGYLAVWDAESGKLLYDAVLPHGPVNGLAVRPDGKAVLLGFGTRLQMQAECDAVVLPLPPLGSPP